MSFIDVLHLPEAATDSASALYTPFQKLAKALQADSLIFHHFPYEDQFLIWFVPYSSPDIIAGIKLWLKELTNPYPNCGCQSRPKGEADLVRQNCAIFKHEDRIFAGCFPQPTEYIGDMGMVGYKFSYQYVSTILNRAFGPYQ